MSSSTLGNTHVINPSSGRPVKIGSRTWRKLVSDGMVKSLYTKDENELYAVQDGDDVDEKIEELNHSLPMGRQAVRGRGRFRKKIVSRRCQPSSKMTTQHTIKRTANRIKDRDTYDSLHENDNFEANFEAMILAELSADKSLTCDDKYKNKYALQECDDTDEDVCTSSDSDY